MNDSAQNDYALIGARMMRVLDDSFERMFLGTMSRA